MSFDHYITYKQDEPCANRSSVSFFTPIELIQLCNLTFQGRDEFTWKFFSRHFLCAFFLLHHLSVDLSKRSIHKTSPGNMENHLWTLRAVPNVFAFFDVPKL